MKRGRYWFGLLLAVAGSYAVALWYRVGYDARSFAIPGAACLVLGCYFAGSELWRTGRRK